MKQKLYFLLLFFWICQSNAQFLDQSNWVTSTGTNLAIEETQKGIIGQSLTADLAGTLTQVKMDLNVIYAATTVDFSIYEGNGNAGNLLGTLPLSFTSTSYGEYTIDVSSLNISTVQGAIYTIVLSNASQFVSGVYTSGDSYTNGEAYFGNAGSNGGVISTAAVQNIDFRFKTYVVPSVTPVDASNLNFDGIDDHVVIPNLNNLNSTEITLEFWFKLSDTNFTGQQTFIAKGNAWSVVLNANGNISFMVAGNSVTSTTSIEDTDWHHCAVSYSNYTRKIFIDGVLERDQFSCCTPIPSNSSNVAIGGNLENSNNFFKGNLEDVRIWNIARTNTGIQGARNCELIGNETGLVAYYKFNNGYDGLNNNDILALNDDSVNNNNGSFVNFALNGLTSNFRSNSIITSGVTIPAAPVAQAQIECLLTAADLTPSPSATVKWYYDPFSDYTLDANSVIYNGEFYYSVLNANGCESERTLVLLNTFDRPEVDYQVAFAINTTASPLTAVSDGTGLLWYTSETGGTGNPIAPTPDTSTLGSTSYWVSSTNNNGCESARSQIEVLITPPPPANDECSGGIALTVGTSQTSNAVTVNLGGATDSSAAPAPDCGGYYGGDVWYTTVVPASGNLNIKTFGTNVNDELDTVLEVYTADCNNLQFLDCNNNDNNTDFSKLVLTGLTPNETIFIRVWENYTTYSDISFQMSVYEVFPPTNDECVSGIALTVGTSRASNAVNVNLEGATDSTSAPSPDCASYNGGDVWYSAVVPLSGNMSVEVFKTNVSIDTGLEVYSGDCNSLIFVDCDDDGGHDAFSKLELSGLIAGETIFIRVWEYDESSSSATFQISAYDAGDGPYAVRINDSEETLTVNHNVLFDLTNQITLESYVKLIDYESYGPIVFKAEVSSFDNGWLLELEDEKVVFYPHGYSNPSVTSTANLDLNTKYHVAATYDGTTASIYIDGVLDNSETLTFGNIINSTFPLVIGSDNDGYYINAEIDLVKIWNVVRTESEIQNNMNNCIPANTGGLIAQYDFEEGPLSATFLDNSGNNLNGTYSNMNYFDWTYGTTCGTTLSVSSILSENDIKLYPNPVNNNLFIEVKTLTNVSIHVLDINGRQISGKKLIGTINSLDTSKLQSGMYFIKIDADQGGITKKFIKN